MMVIEQSPSLSTPRVDQLAIVASQIIEMPRNETVEQTANPQQAFRALTTAHLIVFMLETRSHQLNHT